ncbi:hypothetical protein ABDK00_004940 [Niabella insulamsoli]|uniref:hypothetical protein n=1 Tax=Niabella insulamsoli TaxID=3144874 RepID=UPI0031FCEB9B
MSLNEITLSPYLLAQLYPSSLTASASQPPTAPTAADAQNENPTSNWKFLGNNDKKVLIVVNYSQSVHLPDPQLEFLTQLLKACQLGLSDVALINFNNYEKIDSDAIRNHFDASAILMFGVTPHDFNLPFDIPAYQVQKFAGYTVIHAPALENLQTDKPGKGKLWTGLKQIFNL